MRRKIIIFGLVIVLIVLLFSGCLGGDKSKDSKKSNVLDKFTGTWNGGMYNGEDYDTDEIWIFYQNGSLKQEDSISTEWYTYSIDEDGDLCLEQSDINFLMCYTIEFEENDSVCYLSLGSDIPMFKITKT